MKYKESIKPFSVLMSVYRNDRPEFVERAFNSITIEQTLKPSEIIVVVDGVIPEPLSEVVSRWETHKDYNFKIIRLPENKGLGNALRIGIEAAKYDIVARMDSDDISLPNRFEKQITYLFEHRDCDVVGGQISEFIDSENNIVGIREVPYSNKEIHQWLKCRCPFNHVSVAMLRERVIDVGNYLDWHFNEDYYLWIRMAEAGYSFANLPDTLVNVRVGKDMYARRGGWKYFKSEKCLQDYMLKKHIIGLPRYIYNVIGRFGVQVVLPNQIRAFVFKTFFRKS